MKLTYIQQGFGTKLPLVLLHPFPLKAHFWSNQLRDFSKDRHVIAINFRGFGYTRVEPEDEISIERFAGDIRKTLENAQINKAVFAGCSMGGYVLFELWRQAPELIGGLIFANTRAEADSEEIREKRRAMIEKIREVGTADLPDMAAGFLCDKTVSDKPEIEREVRTWAAEPDCNVIIKSIEMLGNRPNSIPTLATINVPTLVIAGEEDQVTPPDATKRIADNIEDASLVQIPDAGHLSPLENPNAVNSAIAEFLKTID